MRVLWMFLAAAVSLAVAHFLPTATLYAITGVPNNLDATYTAIAADGTSLTRHTTTERVDRRHLRINTELQVEGSAEVFRDSTLNYADTAMPVDRDGLTWLFPRNLDRISYPFYDPRTGITTPADYVGEVQVGPIDAYEYHHSAPDRTFIIEPNTGIVLDRQEDVPGIGAMRWDEDTRQAQYDLASPRVTIMRWLQVFAWVGRAVGVGFAVVGILMVLRSRQRLRTELLSA